MRAVLTGAPGGGKSALLNALSQRGIAIEKEVARTILQQPGGMALREQDPLGFARAMFAAEKASFHRAEGLPAPVLFDRGFPDIVGFLRLEGVDVPREIMCACYEQRYDGPIFRAAPWRKIYRQDAQRIQTWEEALVSDEAVTRAWTDFGYELLDLPFAAIKDRAEFLVGRLG